MPFAYIQPLYSLSCRIVAALAFVVLSGGCASLPFFGADDSAQVADSTHEEAEFEAALHEEEAPDPDSAQAARPRTLREQIRDLEQRQISMQQDISTIKSQLNDLAEMRRDIAAIKQQLGETTFAQTFLPEAEQTNAAKGAAKPALEIGGKSTAADDTMILLPDNAAKPDKAQAAPPKKNATRPKQNEKVRGEAVEPLSVREEPPVRSADNAKPAKENPEPEPVAEKSVKYGDTFKAGQRHVAKKEYKKAIDSLGKVLETNNSAIVKSSAHYWIGYSEYHLGNYREALRHLEESLKNKSATHRDRALVHMAECYIHLGDPEAARKAYQEIVDTLPESELIPRARKMLQIL